MMGLIKGILRRRNNGLRTLSFEDKVALTVCKTASSIVRSHIHRTEKNALFIDMGSNLGQGFRFFSKFYSPDIFDYWLIEPNPFCINKLTDSVTVLYDMYQWDGKYEVKNIAVSRDGGIVKLYGLVEDERGKTSEGASIIKNHNSKYYCSDETRAIDVEAVRVSHLIEQAKDIYSTIVVKMDIESAEYDALEDLINVGLIDDIDHIYVEWHSRFFSDDQRLYVKKREKKIKKILSGKLTDWH